MKRDLPECIRREIPAGWRLGIAYQDDSTTYYLRSAEGRNVCAILPRAEHIAVSFPELDPHGYAATIVRSMVAEMARTTRC